MIRILNKLALLCLTIFLLAWQSGSFKTEQLRYKRVRDSYAAVGSSLVQKLKEKHISKEQLRIYIRAFKQEEKLEVWGKNNTAAQYQLIEEFDICASSGTLGPKRRKGDRQVPEGFYHINRFNPSSNFYLSLGINYPNKSDRILGYKPALGGDIFIHGACVTIGCIPLTDDKIRSVYLYCVEAKNNGQNTIPVTIFPFIPSPENWKTHGMEASSENRKLWSALEKAYVHFNSQKKLPRITFLENGGYQVN